MAKPKVPTVTTEEIAALGRAFARDLPVGLSDYDLFLAAVQVVPVDLRKQWQQGLFLMAAAREYERCERQSAADERDAAMMASQSQEID